MTNFVYFISTTYLKDNTPLNENVDDKLLKSAIKEAQEIYVRDVIEANKAIYNAVDEKANWTGEWHLVASIPESLYYKMKAEGKIQVKASKDIPEHALQAIKTIRVNKDGNLELELYDKVGVLRLLAKASGLLDSPDDSDRPSVIGINIKPPDIEDVEIEEPASVRVPAPDMEDA